MNQESPNPIANAVFFILALGGWGSAVVSHITQIEQGWRMFNLALGSMASLAAFTYWVIKIRSKNK